MSLDINTSYDDVLRSAKPTTLPKRIIKPPPGSLQAPRVEPEIIIPALNTDIRFEMLPKFNMMKHPRAMRGIETLPENFNWLSESSTDNDETKKKKNIITRPGNQMLCGSCWAISVAGILNDNFIVSNITDYNPDISTTYSLSCYPQGRCNGGNPAKLYQDISRGGIVSNRCVDYSWCQTNPNCSGDSTKHFEAKKVDLNTMVPRCGCYDNSSPFYIYKISPQIETIAIGANGVNERTIFPLVRKHILNYGPVCGGYIVFKNFMKGDFTKNNGGVYFERGVYGPNGLESFSDDQATAKNFSGSHAVAIIGWGVEKNIEYDTGKRGDVPYWYCRNSWTSKWGDKGCFKMACFPFNKISQFDKIVQLKTPAGVAQAGGMILARAQPNPVLKKLAQIPNARQLKKMMPNSYYTNEEQQVKGGLPPPQPQQPQSDKCATFKKQYEDCLAKKESYEYFESHSESDIMSYKFLCNAVLTFSIIFIILYTIQLVLKM